MKTLLIVLSCSFAFVSCSHLQADETEVPKGYTRVVLEAVPVEGREINAVVMDQTKEVLKLRIPKGRLPGFLSPKTLVRVSGKTQFEVLVKTKDQKQLDQVVKRLIRPGTLEFAILANQKDHAEIVQEANQLPENKTELLQEGLLVAGWVSPALNAKGKPVEITTQGNIVTRTISVKQEGKVTEQQQFLVLYEQPENRVNGHYLKSVKQTPDSAGLPSIAFAFTREGANRMETLSRKYQPKPDGTAYRLAILLDNTIYTAPSLRGIIGPQGIISGNFTKEEVAGYVTVLNAGALPIPLKVISTTNSQ